MATNKFIKFGSCPQNGSASRPIEWQVLQVRGNDALLVSRYALDCRQYHHEQADITWEDCDLRKWLNNDFLKAAFTEEEQKRILISEVQNNDNPRYGIRGGNITRDRIFCLSIDEVIRYFKNDAERKCRATVMAKAGGAYVCDYGHCWWWLRSPGGYQDCASHILAEGRPDVNGCFVVDGFNAVRPALQIIWNL